MTIITENKKSQLDRIAASAEKAINGYNDNQMSLLSLEKNLMNLVDQHCMALKSNDDAEFKQLIRQQLTDYYYGGHDHILNTHSSGSVLVQFETHHFEVLEFLDLKDLNARIQEEAKKLTKATHPNHVAGIAAELKMLSGEMERRCKID